MNIESKLWKVSHTVGPDAQIIQKATGVARSVPRKDLPSAHTLGMVHENRFDEICRAAFHANP